MRASVSLIQMHYQDVSIDMKMDISIILRFLLLDLHGLCILDIR